MSDNDRLERNTRLLYSIAILLLLMVVVAVRVRLLNAPLERDEGEFAYLGQLLLEGSPPYLNSYSMKPPGIFGAYALGMFLFGESRSGIHLGLLIANSCSVVILYFLAKRLFDSWTALTASASFALLTLSQTVFGVFAHATHFVVLFVLAGLLALVDALEKDSLKGYFFSGILLGISYTMKQHALFLILFGVGYFLLQQALKRRLHTRSFAAGSVALLSGIMTPLLGIGLLLAWSGSFQKFWFWTYSYPSQLVSRMSMESGLRNFWDSFSAILGPFAPLFVLAGGGLALLCSDRQARSQTWFVAGLILFSFLAMTPGLNFSRHYFILLMPAVALLVGICTGFLTRRLSAGGKLMAIPLLVFLSASGYALYQEKNYLFSATPEEVSKSTYGRNPFVESLAVAEYIKQHASVNDRIAILGSEPQIYFYAHRRAATSFNQVYGLMEQHRYAAGMQREMIADIERSRPRHIIMVNIPDSWSYTENSQGEIFLWAKTYIDRNYRICGFIDLSDPDKTVYKWGKDAIGNDPGAFSMMVFERI